MINSKKLAEEVDITTTLGQVAAVYEEVYTSRIKALRDFVLKERFFMDSLYKVFDEIRASRARDVGLAAKKRRGHKAPTVLKKNGKAVAVLISADKRFSGDINRRVFRQFYDFIRAVLPDIVIVGKVGKRYYKDAGLNLPVTYFDAPEGRSKADLGPIIDQIIQYDTVEVFYGRYTNLVHQVPIETNLAAAENSPYLKKLTESVAVRQYLFEPSINQILEFFESEIFTSFFNQSTHESHLADLGSRVSAMEESTNNIRERLGGLSAQLRRIRRVEANRKRLNLLPAILFGG